MNTAEQKDINIIKKVSDMTYEEIMDFIEKAKQTISYYQCALYEVETKFKVLNEQFSIKNERNPIESIKTRIKSWESIAEKMSRRGIPLSIENMEKELNDIAGIRIICSFKEDIYMLSECLLRQDDIVPIERKDYIKNPKPNGYRSLHLIIKVPIFLYHEKKNMKVEVQLRTIAMETWANLEHKLRYKKNLSEETQKNIEKQLLECADICSLMDEKMQNVKNEVNKEYTLFDR